MGEKNCNLKKRKTLLGILVGLLILNCSVISASAADKKKKDVVKLKKVTQFQLKESMVRKSCTFTWKKAEKGTGYKIFIKKGKNKKYEKVRTLKSRKITKWTTKKYFKPGWKCKIRVYQKCKGKIILGPESETKVIKAKEKEQVVLPVSTIYQYPEYPNGCEVTSLAILLNYSGYHVSKQTLVNKYLPMQSSSYGGGTFNDAFLGNIYASGTLGGCYANPICKAGNRYLKEKGDEKSVVKNISGASPDKILTYVNDGMPVAIWATIGMGNSSLFHAGRAANGTNLYWQSASHCLVIRGYNKKQGLVYASDPISGNRTYTYSAFCYRYNQLGKRAVVVTKRG